LLSSQNIDEPGFVNIQYNSFLFNVTLLPQIEFDLVFHIGAFTPKSGAEGNDHEKSTSNIYFTQSLLNALHNQCKKIIFLSTLDVYSSKEEIITEESIISPISLYAHSKYYCEKLIEAWANLHSCAYQILRIGHIYGPGEESYKKIIPVTIKNVLKGQSPKFMAKEMKRGHFFLLMIV